jgi:hypothetical protein
MRARIVAAAPPFAVFLAGACLLGWQSVRVRTFMPDEYIYLTQAREVVRRFPEALFDRSFFYLGFERLHEVLQAAAIAALPPADSFVAGRLIPAVAYASVAFPVWLLARGIGLGRLAATIAAAASVATPWVALATTFLNEPVGYPATAWAVWAIWRCAVRGGVANDVLALLFVALAALSRSQLVVVAGALPITVAAFELRYARARGAGPRLREAARAVARRHGLLVAVVAAGAAWVLLLGGVDAARGYYPASLLPDLGHVRRKAELLVLMFAEGLLLVPFAFALAWIVATLAAGRDRAAFALVVAGVATTALIAYSVAAVSAPEEERYLFYVTPFVILCAIAGLERREAPVALVAAIGAALGALIVATDPLVERDAYDHVASGGRVAWRRLVLGRIYSAAPGALRDYADVLAVAVLLALTVTVAMALRGGGRRARLAAGGTIAAMLLAGVVLAGYALDRYVAEAGDPRGPGFEERTLLDRTLGRDAYYRYLDGDGWPPTEPAVWSEVAFWNGSFQHSAHLGYGHLRGALDRETGRIGPAARLTPELVTIDQYRPVGLAGRLLASNWRIRLYRLARPFRARWAALGGIDPRGLIADGARARFRIFTAGLTPAARQCAAFLLTSGVGGVVMGSAGGRRPARVAFSSPEVARVLEVPLGNVTERPYRDVRLLARGGAQVWRMAVRPCRRGA